MIKIIPPNQFKEIPWKNGQGVTTELAISKGGSLFDFDWRLSIASVVENGPFSDFSGYLRNLVLLEGEGIELHHDERRTDELTALLSVATFDGGCKTIGTLKSGPIKDFNIMVNADKYQVEVETYIERESIKIPSCDLCFVYSLSGETEVIIFEQSSMFESYTLPVQHLIKISSPNEESEKVVNKRYTVTVSGKEMIIVYLTEQCSLI
ncbi:MAG: HutD family protein [Alteromonadaceae bacterium]|nr:HutD family protein [Alteromonadaceae bacterium]